jgi:hypothetical protein
MRHKMPAPQPAHAPFKRTFTLALLGTLAFVSLAKAITATDVQITPPDGGSLHQ